MKLVHVDNGGYVEVGDDLGKRLVESGEFKVPEKPKTTRGRKKVEEPKEA